MQSRERGRKHAKQRERSETTHEWGFFSAVRRVLLGTFVIESFIPIIFLL